MQNQLKFCPDGKIAGFDWQVVIKVTEVLGYDASIVLQLFQYVESGLAEVIKTTKVHE